MIDRLKRGASMRALFLACLLVAGRESASKTDSAVSRSASLVGTWRAGELVNPRADDSDHRLPLGRTLNAYLVYDATGHVFFQSVNGVANRPELRGHWQQADSATLRMLLADAAAYFGTYRVDYSTGSVVHHIEGEIPPNRGTTEIATPFRLFGDTLQLGRDSSVHWIFLRVRGKAPLEASDR